MAERRMFAKTIIDSDAFLDMPLSAQALYFHLSMRADDDGFINNPKKIQRMIGASDDDCKLLMVKRFVIAFESGVIVIKHWKIHNYIQKDRYKPTVYQKEKKLLAEKDNKAYTEIEKGCQTQCIQDVYKVDTQVRLGKDRIVKDSIEGEKGEGEPSIPPRPEQIVDLFNSIVDLFNSICVSFPSVKFLSSKRKEAIESSLNTYTIDDFKQCFELAEKSGFLKGANKRNWVASFDWLINDENMAKVLEGNYNENKPRSFELDEFFDAALKRSENPPKTAGEDEAIKERAERLKERLG